MTNRELIEEIANIQYFVKTYVYGHLIQDKEEYLDKIRNTYQGMTTNEILENLELVRYSAIGAINYNDIHLINEKYNKKKEEIYRECEIKINRLQAELNYEISKVKKLKVDELRRYIDMLE